jgi:hypothetical protein
MDQFLTQYWPNLAGTVSGGIALSLLFFWLKEWLFSLPHVSGIWEAVLITEKSSYTAYSGMKLWYRITLIQSGSAITGVGELDREHSLAKGARSYENSGRRPVEITGTIEKRISRPDQIHIMWSEYGDKRKFSNVFLLNISGSKTRGGLWGRYASTAANSIGYCRWTRTE